MLLKKLKTLVALGESKAVLDDLKVEVIIDKAAKTLTIKDKGIGMTAEEIEKIYYANCFRACAEEFVNQYKDKTPEANAIIGHFGLEFLFGIYGCYERVGDPLIVP